MAETEKFGAGWVRRLLAAGLGCLFAAAAPVLAAGPVHDLVIAHGRVMDPESGLDAVRHLGIDGGVVRAVSATPLQGRRVVDATGLVVAPGFIDLHWHGTDPESHRFQALDGVTASFELEVGVADVDRWYAEREGREPIHHGVAVGHIPVRMAVTGDSGAFLPSGPGAKKRIDAGELQQVLARIEHGLRRGTVAVGLGIAYTPAARSDELLGVFRAAARHRAFTHVHVRGASSAAGADADREAGLLEVIALSAASGAPAHIAHIQSSGQGATARMLDIIRDARANGLDITTECYPYTAGATRIESFLFDSWVDRPEADFAQLQWMKTGERLTRESFLSYRREGGLVFIHANTEAVIRTAVSDPLTMIASDGFDVGHGEGHPRSAGTFSRVLGRHVRELGHLGLMEAIAKMTFMPARRLEARVPAMRSKGRIREGADADLTLFDPARVIDRATYEKPDLASEGIVHVLVEGVEVVRDGRFVDGSARGRGIRAPLQPGP